MTESKPTRVVPLEEARRPELYRLFEELFGSTKGSWLRRRFDWQYLRSPSREAGQPSNWVVLQGDRLIGHCGMIYNRMLVDGVDVQGCWGCDLIAHPAHRQGRYILALFALLDRAADLPMGYGMADHVSAIYSKRGYLPVGIASHRIRFLSPGAAFRLRPVDIATSTPAARRAAALRVRLRTLMRHLAGRSKGPGPPTRASEAIDLSGTPPVELDALWSAVAGGYPVCVVRDRRHLEWRYDPEETSALYLTAWSGGRLRACLVLEAFTWRGLRVGQISEVLLPREDVPRLLPSLVHEAVRAFESHRLHAVLTEGFPADVRRILEGAGFLALERETENLVVLDRHGRFDRSLLADPDHWFLGPGDGDRSTPYPRLELRARSGS